MTKADKRYNLILVLGAVLFIAGCSSENQNPPAAQSPAANKGSGPTNATSVGAAEATVASSPKYEAVIVINAAKKNKNGPSCSTDMATKGSSNCGPVSSLTELAWEFTEHRDGSDYFKFNWDLTTNGESKNHKSLTVGFDGGTESMVIDAEHYIVIRKGPLITRPENDK